MHEPSIYREMIGDRDLVSFRVTIKETDLYIKARSRLWNTAFKATSKYRTLLERYIAKNPIFGTSLKPLSVEKTAPQIVQDMIKAGATVGTGPMAAVAGAIAEYVGRELLPFSEDVIVENRGDIFLTSTKKRFIGIYAGDSSLSNRIALEIDPGDTPLGICTSSGTFGYSLSLGKCDAVTVLSHSTCLADATATAIGNIVKVKDDITGAIELTQQIPGITAVVIIFNDEVALWGQAKIVRVELE